MSEYKTYMDYQEFYLSNIDAYLSEYDMYTDKKQFLISQNQVVVDMFDKIILHYKYFLMSMYGYTIDDDNWRRLRILKIIFDVKETNNFVNKLREFLKIYDSITDVNIKNQQRIKFIVELWIYNQYSRDQNIHFFRFFYSMYDHLILVNEYLEMCDYEQFKKTSQVLFGEMTESQIKKSSYIFGGKIYTILVFRFNKNIAWDDPNFIFSENYNTIEAHHPKSIYVKYPNLSNRH